MPMSLSRRQLLQLTAPLALGATVPGAASADDGDLPGPIAALKPRLDGVVPISLDERRARLLRAQKLLAETGLDA
ncbi:MAG TPA: aminopeptidase P family protein, partial [Vicinamibacteria bacterium]|nr:aminopeptidase P family protein [Vicinamibacteria bacterium]